MAEKIFMLLTRTDMHLQLKGVRYQFGCTAVNPFRLSEDESEAQLLCFFVCKCLSICE